MPKTTIIVRALWDPEASVWVAESDDVPGLILEAADPNTLQAKLQVMIPELLEINDCRDFEGLKEVPVVIVSEQLSRVRVPEAA